MGNPTQQKGSTPKIPATPEEQDKIRRAAKARQKKSKNLADASNGFFAGVLEDRKAARLARQQQRMEENLAHAMNHESIASLREGSLMHRAVMEWFKNYADATPGEGCFQRVTDISFANMQVHTYPVQCQRTITRGFRLAKRALHSVIYGDKPKQLVTA